MRRQRRRTRRTRRMPTVVSAIRRPVGVRIREGWELISRGDDAGSAGEWGRA
jgi:hypothetical protein